MDQYAMIKHEEIEISTDKKRLDVDMIHAFLTHSYWAMGRTREQVVRSIEKTVCFGVYINGKQIGFARVLTDEVVFAYLMDLFILEDYRSRGYARKLLNQILQHKDFLNVKKWFLGTRDAQGLYKKHGFTEVDGAIVYMDRLIY